MRIFKNTRRQQEDRIKGYLNQIDYLLDKIAAADKKIQDLQNGRDQLLDIYTAQMTNVVLEYGRDTEDGQKELEIRKPDMNDLASYETMVEPRESSIKITVRWKRNEEGSEGPERAAENVSGDGDEAPGADGGCGVCSVERNAGEETVPGGAGGDAGE